MYQWAYYKYLKLNLCPCEIRFRIPISKIFSSVTLNNRHNLSPDGVVRSNNVSEDCVTRPLLRDCNIQSKRKKTTHVRNVTPTIYEEKL